VDAEVINALSIVLVTSVYIAVGATPLDAPQAPGVVKFNTTASLFGVRVFSVGNLAR